MKKLLFLGLIMGITNSLFAADTSAIPSMSDSSILWLLVGLGVLFLIVIVLLADTIKKLAGASNVWSKNFDKYRSKGTGAVILLFLLSSLSSFAAGETAVETYKMSSTFFWMLVLIDLMLLKIIFALIYIIKRLTKAIEAEEEKEVEDLISQWSTKLNDLQPLERENEILLDHDYDGIRELDNNLPPWWVYMFYLCIVFAVVYIFHYHVLGTGPSSLSEYNSEMAIANAEKEAFLSNMADKVNENNVEPLTDDVRLTAGKAIFEQSCATCHGKSGEGLAGPNFTDEYWIHGGGIKNVFKTIKYGVPEKGMIAWETQLSPAQMHEVGSYILTLAGTNPPNPKAPEGEIWKESDTAPSAEVKTDSTAVQDTTKTEVTAVQ